MYCIEQFNGNTPLIDAAEGGHIDVVKLLAQWGADLDAVNKVSLPPVLHFANILIHIFAIYNRMVELL